MQTITKKIQQAESIILSTHRHSDGDGVGAQLALFHALRSSGKRVRIVNPDPVPEKYNFLNPHQHIQYFSETPNIDLQCDAVLILDTNDRRLLSPMFESMQAQAKEIIFIDHHPLLTSGPTPDGYSWINTRAASTGEMIYELILSLGLSLNTDVAQSLYTSITFDTQLYRYVRASSTSHRIAAELLKFDFDAAEIHRRLFGSQSRAKMFLLAKTISELQFYGGNKIGCFTINSQDLKERGLSAEDARDIADFIMNMESLQVVVMLREDQARDYKISLRSKGQISVLPLAEKLGGGGHLYSAGAYIKGDGPLLQQQIIEHLLQAFRDSENVPR